MGLAHNDILWHQCLSDKHMTQPYMTGREMTVCGLDYNSTDVDMLATDLVDGMLGDTCHRCVTIHDKQEPK